MTRTLQVAMALSMICAMRAAGSMEPAELFSTHEPLSMDITADMRGFCRNPDEEDCADVPAVIAYREDEGRERRIEAGLRIRGRWDAHTADCTLPSLFLVLAPAASTGTLFAGQEELPLTTHCRPGGNYEQYVLTEYVAHRIYNLLTEKIDFPADAANYYLQDGLGSTFMMLDGGQTPSAVYFTDVWGNLLHHSTGTFSFQP